MLWSSKIESRPSLKNLRIHKQQQNFKVFETSNSYRLSKSKSVETCNLS